MDFKFVLEQLLHIFHEKQFRYALMGGFALGAQGVARSTVDIDFLIHRDDLEKVHGVMRGLGYERIYRSDNVSQYVSPLDIFGEVDFVHAFREISARMLDRAEEKRVFNHTMPVKVLRVEDIIGLKIQAIANDASRTSVDLGDIESLMALHKSSLDWDAVAEYFSLFEFDELFAGLKRKYRHDG